MNAQPVVDLEQRRREQVPLDAPPPHSVAAEKAAIAAVLTSPDTVLPHLLADGLTPQHFYRGPLGTVFAAMIEMRDAGTAIDVVTLTEHLHRAGTLGKVGTETEIDALTAACPAVGHARDYGRIIRDAAARRTLITAGHDLHAAAHGVGSPYMTAAVVADRLAAHSAGSGPAAVSAAAFVARDRPAAAPLVRSANHGRPADLLTAGSSILLAGPSGYGKTLAAIDLVGLLASDDGGDWLGATVTGQQRVVLALLEGTEDDIAGRLRDLVPADALERVFVLDRWASPLPTSPEALGVLARAVAHHDANVLFVDTGAALLAGWEDTSRGLTEDHYRHFDSIRRGARTPHLALGISTHTRKADRTGAKVDEAEEIAGTFVRKVDAAIVIRPDGEDNPRRRITFAKVRSGPRPPALVATLPDADSDDPPRLTVIAEARPKLKEGTEAERIAEWITNQPDAPHGVSVITAALDISADTLRRRRDELDQLGIRYGRIPGRGHSHGYGTTEQWKTAHGFTPDLDPNPAPTPHDPTPHVRGKADAGSEGPETQALEPRNPATPHDPPAGYETPENTGDQTNPATPHPLTGMTPATAGAGSPENSDDTPPLATPDEEALAKRLLAETSPADTEVPR